MPWRSSSSRRNSGLAGGLESTMPSTKGRSAPISGPLADYIGRTMAFTGWPLQASVRFRVAQRLILDLDGRVREVELGLHGLVDREQRVAGPRHVGDDDMAA